VVNTDGNEFDQEKSRPEKPAGLLNFITGQNEREETTQDTIVTKSAACASYEINYVTYIRDPTLLLVKMKEKKLLKIQPLPKVLRARKL
jgi:hypothetical protein